MAASRETLSQSHWAQLLLDSGPTEILRYYMVIVALDHYILLHTLICIFWALKSKKVSLQGIRAEGKKAENGHGWVNGHYSAYLDSSFFTILPLIGRKK